MDGGGGKCEVGELCMWWRVLFCPFCCFLRFRSVLFHSLFTYLTYVPISSKNFARDMVTLFSFIIALAGRKCCVVSGSCRVH